MVRFEKEKIVIEISTLSPSETWLELHSGICAMARNVTQNSIDDTTFNCVIDFLDSMMPDWKEAKKMLE